MSLFKACETKICSYLTLSLSETSSISGEIGDKLVVIAIFTKKICMLCFDLQKS